jgi:hypothetical protein
MNKKNNKKVMIKSLVLSTLLMSAISGSAYAEKSEGGPEQSGTTRQAFTVTSISSSNPLKLAAQYAPDTVKDWETVLARYDQLRGLPANQTSVQLTMTKAIGAAHSMESIDLSKVLVATGEIAGEADAVTVTATAPVQVQGLTDLVAVASAPALQATTPSGLPEDAAGLTDITRVSATLPGVQSPLFASKEKLSDAEASKDAAAIRTALTELLEQYKQEIADMEAAGE